MTYYLPMRYVEAVYERKATPSVASAESKVSEATKALNEARAASAAKLAEKQKLDRVIADLGSAGLTASDKELKELLIQRSEAKVDAERLTGRVTSLQQALAQAEQLLDDARQHSDGCFDRLTVRPLQPTADLKARFSLKSHHLATRTETATLKTDTSGLLTNIEAEATDQTGGIIVDLARSIAGVQTGLSRFAIKRPAVRTPPACNEQRVVQTIDPIDSAQWQDFAAEVKRSMTSEISIVPDATQTPDPARESRGIAYRRDLPLRLNVVLKDEAGAVQSMESLVINVPNHSPIEILPVRVGPFGKTELDAAFSKGMLIETSQIRRSEIAEAATVPFRAIQAIGSAVSEVLQIKIDTTSKETELSQAQLELLEALEALRERQSIPSGEQ